MEQFEHTIQPSDIKKGLIIYTGDDINNHAKIINIKGNVVTLETLHDVIFEGETTEKGTQFDETKESITMNWIKWNPESDKNNEEQNTQTDAAVIAQIESQIKASCTKAKYTNLCQRIQTSAGLAYTVNRCINMMAKDKIHLSSCLATLEAEEEGIN